jgi:hypothetical protein
LRIAGHALLGLLSGAIVGLTVAVLGTTLWYDVLRIGSTGPEGMGGVGTLFGLAVALPVLFGVAGAVWLGLRGRRASAAPSCALVVALVLAPLLVLLCVLLFGMG